MGCGNSKGYQENSTAVGDNGRVNGFSNGIPSNGRILNEHVKLIQDNHKDITNSSPRVKDSVFTLEEGELFCDPEFPADVTSLYCTEQPGRPKDIEWRRPKDLVPSGLEPHLLVDGISRDDIKQGILGDCWFLSSCAAVSQQERFMRKIIPEDQPLIGKDYKGMVHFRTWRFGEWVNICIDDRLPCRDGELIYARCEDPTEFWVALVEKAYAKLHGSYEAIEGGQTMDALVDLTGGLAERYELKGADPNMYRHLLRAHKAGAFVACSRKGDWREATIADENGLVSGHAYTVTKVMRMPKVVQKRSGQGTSNAGKKISHKMGEERLLRIRNPWGNETEWKGSWSDNDTNWEWVDEETKQFMQMEKRDDGEFWMNYKDFCRQFQEVTICTTGPDFDGDGITDEAGHMECIRGSWNVGQSAGGSRNDLEKFASNPQYVLTLTEPDDFEALTDDPENEGRCSVVIALMQDHRRMQSDASRAKPLQIGFILYQTSTPKQRLKPLHFKYNYESGKSGIYINLREVSGRFELEPGHYVIIPSTFKPNETGEFMLRIFAQKRFKVSVPR